MNEERGKKNRRCTEAGFFCRSEEGMRIKKRPVKNNKRGLKSIVEA